MLNATYVELHATDWFDEFDNNISGSMHLDDYANVANLTCDDASLWDWTECTYTWDSSTIADGNYFIDVNMWTATGTTASAHSTQQVIVDNSAPTASVGNVSSTAVYSNRVYLSCSDTASGCKQIKWYYFNSSNSCSSTKSDYSSNTTDNFLDIVTDHSDYLCLWVENRADFNTYVASPQLHVETAVTVVSSIPSQTQSIVTQDLNNECTMYVDQGVIVGCDFKSTIKISEFEKDLNRVYKDRPEIIQTPPKTLRVLVQNEVEGFYHKDYFLRFESDARTITSQGEEKDFPTTVVRRRVIPLITTDGQLEIGTLIIKIRQR